MIPTEKVPGTEYTIKSARLSVQSSELGPLTRKRVLPPFGSKRGEPLACGKGVRGPNSEEGGHSALHCCNPSTDPGSRPKYHFSRAWVYNTIQGGHLCGLRVFSPA
jgi:hypothetical protein